MFGFHAGRLRGEFPDLPIRSYGIDVREVRAAKFTLGTNRAHRKELHLCPMPSQNSRPFPFFSTNTSLRNLRNDCENTAQEHESETFLSPIFWATYIRARSP
jgi:hypothetical protein